MTTSIPISLSEYNAVRRNGCGVIDLSSRGRIRVSGSEAVMFLNGLITNDMKTLEELRWMPAVFPNVQGRLIAAVRVIRLQGDEGFLLDTEAPTHQALLKTIERFTMAGDFKVADVTGATSMLSIQGRQANEVIEHLTAVSVAAIPANGVFETRWNDISMTGIRASHAAEDGFDLLVQRDATKQTIEALTALGVTPISEETFDVLRIEAGIGRFGQDMDETNVVIEANLDDAISFTKGCYIGQEIIIRIKHRGHVAKKLTGLRFEASEVATPGELINSSEGKEIGRITSATFSPALESAIALAYVRYEHLTPGSEVLVGENNKKAVVTELPFIKVDS
jgi:folate-binding protein YgfZ